MDTTKIIIGAGVAALMTSAFLLLRVGRAAGFAAASDRLDRRRSADAVSATRAAYYQWRTGIRLSALVASGLGTRSSVSAK